MLTYDRVVIVLGTGNTSEIRERTKVGVSLHIENPRSLLFFTGTPKEIQTMIAIAYGLYPHCNISYEDKSRNTIENIVNSFSVFPITRTHGARTSVIEHVDGCGVPSLQEVPDYEFIVVSSDYHIDRVRFICDNLTVSMNRKIKYYVSETSDKVQLQKRIETEKYIFAHIDQYASMIIQVNETFKNHSKESAILAMNMD